MPLALACSAMPWTRRGEGAEEFLDGHAADLSGANAVLKPHAAFAFGESSRSDKVPAPPTCVKIIVRPSPPSISASDLAGLVVLVRQPDSPTSPDVVSPPIGDVFRTYTAATARNRFLLFRKQVAGRHPGIVFLSIRLTWQQRPCTPRPAGRIRESAPSSATCGSDLRFMKRQFPDVPMAAAHSRPAEQV